MKSRTIASHGHPVNRKIKMANNEIIDPEFYEWADIDIEAYDQNLLNKTDCYISDATLLLNYGWAYGTSLYEVIKKGCPIIYFLAHPSNWVYNFKNRLKLAASICLNGVRIEQRTFKPRFK